MKKHDKLRAANMKSLLLSVMLACPLAAAVPAWTYALPDTGLAPSAFSYEFASSMRERHNGSSHFGMQNASLTIPLSDPRRTSVRGWTINAELDSTISFVDAEGSLKLESETLYKFTLPVSLIHSRGRGERVILAVAPTVTSDLERAARCFDLGLFAAWTKPLSEELSFTLGIAAYPRFARYYAVPVFGFEWKPLPRWTVALKGYRFTVMKELTERFSAGVVAAARGGVWNVETERGARMLNVQSFVLGVTGEYDFSAAGQRKRIITASLGSTLATSVRFHEYRGERDADEAHHYRPGLYASFGVDFRF